MHWSTLATLLNINERTLEYCMLANPTSDYISYPQLYPVLDVLSISTGITEEDAKTVCLSLTSSWSKSLKVLKLFFERELRISSGSSDDYHYLLQVLGCAAKSSESSNSGSKLQLALPQLSELMNRLLSAANRDQAKSWFELLHKEVWMHTVRVVNTC